MRITVTIILLPVIYALTAPGQTLLAEGADVQDVTPEQGRVVHFPADRCMGVLYIQDEGVENRHSKFRSWVIGLDRPRQLWYYFAPAQGDVMVPAGKRLRLYVGKREWQDLSPLQKLRSDDLYSLFLMGKPSAITKPSGAFLMRIPCCLVLSKE